MPLSVDICVGIGSDVIRHEIEQKCQNNSNEKQNSANENNIILLLLKLKIRSKQVLTIVA